ncbi:MAG: BMP family ABC transporter substrate-binding protein [Exilispira sp.]
MKRSSFLIYLSVVIVISGLLLFSCSKAADSGKSAEFTGKTIKAGFIYVGPVGDFGWSNAHDLGRKYVESKFPWLKTVYIESVPEGDVERYIDRLINEEKCDIVFTTSFGFMDGTVAAAKKYPDKIFMHCSGYKREKNLGTYFAELYQAYYLNGLMAGALTKSGKVGYIGAHPIPEVVRHINAFALGVKEANPDAKVYVRWLFSWYDPAKAKEAAESLISEGVDALAFTEDSTAVVDVGQEHTKNGKQIYVFSHYSPMQKFGPDTVVSGQLVDWGIMYEEILRRVYTNTWDNRDYWWLMKEKACLLGGEFGQQINPKFVDQLKSIYINDLIYGKISVYDLIMKRISQMSEPTVLFDPFTGPIKDNKGILKIDRGVRASYELLWNIDWFVSNVVGNIPKQ